MNPGSVWAAGDYEAVAARIAGIADEVVDAVSHRCPLAGAAVVDLACGTGSATFAAAARGARVTGVDATPELLAIAATKAEASGSVVWTVADAADTGLPAGSADAVISNMGIIFVEPVAQVEELARLLKPEGTLGFSAWVRVADNPLIDPITTILGPPPATFTPDEWGQPATATARLSPDFTDIEITTDVHTWEFDSVPAALYFLSTESPMHVAAIERAGERRTALLAAFEAAFAAHAGTDGRVVVVAPYTVTTARRR